MSQKLKIIVSAYACEPYKGSEIGVGWHWVLEMSKYFELWVITRENNQKPIERYFEENNIQTNINFLYYDLPYFILKFKKGMRGVRIYYTLWQYGVNGLIKKVMQENDIHIFHLLTYGNALWHVSSYGQKQFFVWGPTGGVDIIEWEFSRHYRLRNRLVELVRKIVVKTLPLNLSFCNRCKNANLILCKAESTLKAIPKKYQDKAIIFTDVATDITLDKYEQQFEHDGLIEYLVVGKLDSWRGFDLLVEAFESAVKQNQNIHLTIMGEGSDKERIKNMIFERGLEKYITMIGQVSMDEYYKYMRECDVVVNPSLKEGAVTVAFDSMSFGKPFICVDTTGYTQYFTNDYSIVIPKTSRVELIQNLKNAILKLTGAEERKKLSEAIIKVSEKVSWETKGKKIAVVIHEAYEKRRNEAE